MLELKLEVTNLIKPFGEFFKILSEEWDNLFEIGLYDYLHSQTEKYYYTNTFLHLNEKVKFYETYYPIRARYKNLDSDFMNLEKVFSEYRDICIIGSAGCGKTTLIRHIFLQTIKEFKTLKKIPILIELRNLNTFNGDFESLIIEKVLKTRSEPNKDIFIRSIRKGDYIFLLDGFDEIYSHKKEEIFRQIELFIDSYFDNIFIISSRPGSGIEAFQRFYGFKVSNLSNNDVVDFVLKNVSNVETKQRILEIINQEDINNYNVYLQNPLLLSMFILAIYSHPEIPSRKTIFYKNVFDTLYSRHDAHTKGSYPRERFANLEREEYEKILELFSFLASFEGRFEFTEEFLTKMFSVIKEQYSLKYRIQDLITDLRTQISILTLDGFLYSFPHRSMQEYFMANFLSKLKENNKESFYIAIQDMIFKSNENFHNFFLMCEELDKISFYKYFVIPTLKSHIEKFQNSGVLLVQQYSESLNIKLILDSVRKVFIKVTMPFYLETKGKPVYFLLTYFKKPTTGDFLQKFIKRFKVDSIVNRKKYGNSLLNNSVDILSITKAKAQGNSFSIIGDCILLELKVTSELIEELTSIIEQDVKSMENLISKLIKK